MLTRASYPLPVREVVSPLLILAVAIVMSLVHTQCHHDADPVPARYNAELMPLIIVEVKSEYDATQDLMGLLEDPGGQ